MNMRGFFCLVKHAEAYFVVNLQLKIDYAIHFGKFAKNLSIYEKTLANIRNDVCNINLHNTSNNSMTYMQLCNISLHKIVA